MKPIQAEGCRRKTFCQQMRSFRSFESCGHSLPPWMIHFRKCRRVRNWSLPRQRVAYKYGLRSINHGLPRGIVAYCFGQLGFPDASNTRQNDIVNHLGLHIIPTFCKLGLDQAGIRMNKRSDNPLLHASAKSNVGHEALSQMG